jgi:hypothetical protein
MVAMRRHECGYSRVFAGEFIRVSRNGRRAQNLQLPAARTGSARG